MTLSPPGRTPKKKQIKCADCALRKNESFREFSAKELKFVQKFKSGELIAEAGTTILLEGNNSAHLYTILSGWVFKYKLLEDGRRQILNFGMPGDFFGLQTSVFDALDHSVEALTEVVLCVFPREKIWTIYNEHPGLGFDLTWVAAREERVLDENLLTVGRRTAIERVATALLHIFVRLEQLGMTADNKADVPFTQQHLADALGLSHIHTNRTIRKLSERKLVNWEGRRLEIRDQDALSEIAAYDVTTHHKRPLF